MNLRLEEPKKEEFEVLRLFPGDLFWVEGYGVLSLVRYESELDSYPEGERGILGFGVENGRLLSLPAGLLATGDLKEVKLTGISEDGTATYKIGPVVTEVAD